MSQDGVTRPMLAPWLLGAASSALAGPMAGAVRIPYFAWLKCLIAVLVLAANGQCQVNSSSGLQDKIRILEQQGVPTTGERLLKRYQRGTSTADSHKWSDILEQLKTLQLQGNLNGEIPLLGDEFHDRFVGGFIAGSVWKAGPASAKFSEQHRQLLEQVKALSASTGAVRLPFEFHGADTELPFGSIETLARMVMVDALVAIDSKQADRVMEDIRALSKIADLMEPIPALPAKLECMRLRRYGVTAIQLAMEIDVLEQTQLARLDSLLTERSNLGQRWKQLLDDDITWNVPILLDPGMAAQATGLRPQRFDPTLYIAITQSIGQISCADWNVFLRKCIELEAKLDKDVDTAKTPDELVAYLIIPAIPMVAHRLIDEAQLFRQARLAIAVRKYEAEQGVFPDRLDVLPLPTHAWTPLGSKPFGFMSKNDAALLWGFHVASESLETPDHPPPPPIINTASMQTRDIRWLLRK